MQGLPGQGQSCATVTMNAPQAAQDAVGEGARSAIEWLGSAAGGVLQELSDSLSAATRSQLKLQKSAFDVKLENNRRGSAVQMRNQVAEIESTHKTQMKEKFAALLAGGDTALKDAHRKLEGAQTELSELKLKFEGLESAMSMAQQRLKASEAQVRALEQKEEEAKLVAACVAACDAQLCEELRNLKLKRLAIPEKPTDEKLKAVMDAHAAGIAELLAAKEHFEKACKEAEIVVPQDVETLAQGTDHLLAVHKEDVAQVTAASAEAAAAQQSAAVAEATRDELQHQVTALHAAKVQLAGDTQLN